MTTEDLASLYQHWKFSCRRGSFKTWLEEKLLQRRNADKVKRCLMCGICMPGRYYRATESVYEELCKDCVVE